MMEDLRAHGDGQVAKTIKRLGLSLKEVKYFCNLLSDLARPERGIL